jgi:CheY-like chemotaxis protein
MLTPLLGEGIELETRLAEGLGRVKADEGQIEQALLNLAVNARDAMPRGGRIVIETANRDPHPAARDAGTGAAGGGFVAISVSDTGHGMDAVTLSHLFEPFFTTKAAEKGTGLGLASVYGIVQQSGGRIDVQSAPGQGTCFLISLPRTMGDAEPTLPLRSVAGSGGHETLLLVEDDEALRSVTREILEAAGYRVLAASRPDDAARVSLEHGERIDLLLSDVVMPSRSGPELAAELLSRRPELRVLYTSGYTSDAAALQGLAESGARPLQKPFTSAELLREVRAALDQAPPPTS